MDAAWTCIVNDIREVGDAHMEVGKAIKTDVAAPLATFAKEQSPVQAKRAQMVKRVLGDIKSERTKLGYCLIKYRKVVRETRDTKAANSGEAGKPVTVGAVEAAEMNQSKEVEVYKAALNIYTSTHKQTFETALPGLLNEVAAFELGRVKAVKESLERAMVLMAPNTSVNPFLRAREASALVQDNCVGSVYTKSNEIPPAPAFEDPETMTFGSPPGSAPDAGAAATAAAAGAAGGAAGGVGSGAAAGAAAEAGGGAAAAAAAAAAATASPALAPSTPSSGGFFGSLFKRDMTKAKAEQAASGSSKPTSAISAAFVAAVGALPEADVPAVAKIMKEEVVTQVENTTGKGGLFSSIGNFFKEAVARPETPDAFSFDPGDPTDSPAHLRPGTPPMGGFPPRDISLEAARQEEEEGEGVAGARADDEAAAKAARAAAGAKAAEKVAAAQAAADAKTAAAQAAADALAAEKAAAARAAADAQAVAEEAAAAQAAAEAKAAAEEAAAAQAADAQAAEETAAAQAATDAQAAEEEVAKRAAEETAAAEATPAGGDDSEDETF